MHDLQWEMKFLCASVYLHFSYTHTHTHLRLYILYSAMTASAEKIKHANKFSIFV